MEFEEGHAKKMPSKGGARQKILGVRGGGGSPKEFFQVLQ